MPHVAHLKMEMKMDSIHESLKAVSGTIKCSTNFVSFFSPFVFNVLLLPDGVSEVMEI